MKPADRRLASLAAAMAPTMAERLLGRLAGGASAVVAATRLAAESRGVRLAALAEALGSDGEPLRRERLLAAPSAERPAVGAALRALAPGDHQEDPGLPCPAPAPLVARLCVEHLESLLREAE